MEDCVDDIVHQLGADKHGRVSFEEFSRCRRGLVAEIEKEQQKSLQASTEPSNFDDPLMWQGNIF